MAFTTTAACIDAAEDELGVAFPLPLRRRWLAENGGALLAAGRHWELFPVRDTSDRRRLKRTANHVVLETTLGRGWPGFPARGVAIARDGGGDLLILLPAPDPSAGLDDRVFIWRHGVDEPPLPVSMETVLW